MRWTTEHTANPCQFVVNGKWERDGFACVAKPYCPGLYQGKDAESIHFQRLLLADLHKGYEKNNTIACVDQRDGKQITYWEMFDRHALTLWCLEEQSRKKK